MEWGLGCCCGEKACTVGFWGACDQSTWATGIDFPSSWTKLFSRTKDNLADCNVLVVGRYSFSSPYTAQPSTAADYTAVSSWITGGGVLLVFHEYYGFPSIVPSTPVTALNTFLTGISAQAMAGVTASPEPNSTDTPIGTYSTSVSHPLLSGVDKLYVAAPGRMTLGTSTLLFEARKSPFLPYASVLSIESYGYGSIVFCADHSMVNNSAAATAITSAGNKINKLLANLCAISAN
jgi:hypothetical protein